MCWKNVNHLEKICSVCDLISIWISQSFANWCSQSLHYRSKASTIMFPNSKWHDQVNPSFFQNDVPHKFPGMSPFDGNRMKSRWVAKLKTLSVPGFPHLKNQTGTKEQPKDPRIFLVGRKNKWDTKIIRTHWKIGIKKNLEAIDMNPK